MQIILSDDQETGGGVVRLRDGSPQTAIDQTIRTINHLVLQDNRAESMIAGIVPEDWTLDVSDGYEHGWSIGHVPCNIVVFESDGATTFLSINKAMTDHDCPEAGKLEVPGFERWRQIKRERKPPRGPSGVTLGPDGRR